MNRPLSKNFTQLENLSENGMWLIGWIVTDGYIKCISEKSHYSLEFGLKSEDALELLPKFASVLGYQKLPLMKVYDVRAFGKTYKAGRFSFCSQELIEILDEKYNLKFRNMHIVPKLLQNTEERFICAFLRGVFEGDGSITVSKIKNTFSYRLSICGEPSFLNDIESLLSKLKIKVSNIQHRHDISILWIQNRKSVFTFFKKCYGGEKYYFLSRKRNKFCLEEEK